MTVSHFLLDLRGVDASLSEELSTGGMLGTQQSSLRFTAFMAPIGGSLDVASYEGHEDEDLEMPEGGQNHEV